MAGSIALEQKSLRVQTVKIGESSPVSSGFLSFDTCSMPLDSIKIEIVRAKGRNSRFRSDLKSVPILTQDLN